MKLTKENHRIVFDNLREFYSNEIRRASKLAGSNRKLSTKLGLNLNAVHQTLKTGKLDTLRRYYEMIQKET